MTRPKSDFLTQAKAALPRAQVKVPGVKGPTYMRALSEAERKRITDACLLPGKTEADGDAAFDEDVLTAAIIAATLADARGARLIPPGREAEIYDLPVATVNELKRAMLSLNGWGAADSGNGSKATRAGGSSTASGSP